MASLSSRRTAERLAALAVLDYLIALDMEDVASALDEELQRRQPAAVSEADEEASAAAFEAVQDLCAVKAGADGEGASTLDLMVRLVRAHAIGRSAAPQPLSSTGSSKAGPVAFSSLEGAVAAAPAILAPPTLPPAASAYVAAPPPEEPSSAPQSTDRPRGKLTPLAPPVPPVVPHTAATADAPAVLPAAEEMPLPEPVPSPPSPVATIVATSAPSATGHDAVDESSAPLAWTAAEIKALRKAAKQFPASMDKAVRFKSIAGIVGSRSKKECHDKYKELLAAQRAKQKAGNAAAHEDENAEEDEDAEEAPATPAAATKPPPVPGGSVSMQALRSQIIADVTGHSAADAPAPVPAAPDTSVRPVRAAATRRGQEIVLDEEREPDAETQAPPASAAPVLAAAAPTSWSISTAALPPPPPPVPVAAPIRRGGARGVAAETVLDADEDADTPQTITTSSSTRHVPMAAPARATGFAPPSGTWDDDDGALASRSKQAANSQQSTSAPADVMLDVEEEDDAAASASGAPTAASAARGAPSATGGVATPAPCVALNIDMLAVMAAATIVRSHKVTASFVTIEDAARLRMLLFGEGRGARSKRTGRVSVRAFNDEWMMQGLAFTSTPGLSYGLVQFKGGPCGALAVLQAEVLRHMFYSDVSFFDGACAADGLAGVEPSSWRAMEAEGCSLEPSVSQQQRCLVLAMTDIIWRARGSTHACVAVVDESSAVSKGASLMLRVDDVDVSYAPDGITERLRVLQCARYEDVAAVIESHLSLFCRVNGPGIVLLVYSVMLTRGLSAVAMDMDTGMGATASLIGEHSYATQELVNLMLVGAATSNVFDGERDMSSGDDKLILRGIPMRSRVGFLTLFEHYKYMEVGAHYKQPHTPVWVICSESHYSVAFAAPRGVAYTDAALRQAVKAAEKGRKNVLPVAINARGLAVAAGDAMAPFDLLYYDGLARQDELIRLTLSPGSAEARSRASGAGNMKMGLRTAGAAETEDDAPPLERVFRTRWPGVSVSWNASDPLL